MRRITDLCTMYSKSRCPSTLPPSNLNLQFVILVSLVRGILDPFWALPFVAIAITYFNALICIYWLAYNKIRDSDRLHFYACEKSTILLIFTANVAKTQRRS